MLWDDHYEKKIMKYKKKCKNLQQMLLLGKLQLLTWKQMYWEKEKRWNIEDLERSLTRESHNGYGWCGKATVLTSECWVPADIHKGQACDTLCWAGLQHPSVYVGRGVGFGTDKATTVSSMYTGWCRWWTEMDAWHMPRIRSGITPGEAFWGLPNRSLHWPQGYS